MMQSITKEKQEPEMNQQRMLMLSVFPLALTVFHSEKMHVTKLKVLDQILGK